MKKVFLFFINVTIFLSFINAQKPEPTPNPNNTNNNTTHPITPAISKPNTPKPYKEVITDKAISKKGLFTIHKVDDKFYFEIPDSILHREILAVTRYAKVPGGGRTYGGEIANQQAIEFEKGPSNNIFLKVVTLISYADSTNVISNAVSNSNVNPIAAAFSIAAYGKDSATNTSSSVIDVTDFFKGDNQVVSINPMRKKSFNITSIASDRSFIESIHTYPINTEIKTVKTFNVMVPSSGMSMIPSPFPSTPTTPAAEASGVITVELNTSLLLLPKTPMKRRFFDPRVGFFADNYVLYSDDQQKVENQTFAVRYRLEPKEEDLEKYKRGELVEPKKQIVYYIDPATPKKWRPFLIQGINDWQKAFEKAGFKNAIVGKEWPENDSTMSLEDARFCVIRYFASDIENAYGPNVHDPRSGEIIESHIGWYHNVMKLVHDWYFVQTAAVDPKARKMIFDDSLMGQLIRFVSSHEVGHTLGLRHNMGSSSKTPVEKLRDKAWVEANGHTASIMDYARFNYVAQPEDNIGEIGLFPRIGDYDKWAIEWGYKYVDAKDEKEDQKINNKWVVEQLKANPRLWFGGEGYNADPRAQTEDLGDNSMKASEYGIKNLKRIMPHLIDWTNAETDKYENLSEMYSQITGQYNRYINHVLKNVGGVYETFKSVEDKGDVYEPTPKSIQKSAVSFLNTQLFETPNWLLDKNILNKINSPTNLESVETIQINTINNLFSAVRLYRLITSNTRYGNTTYSVDELLNDTKSGVWKELTTKSTIDIYRRNIQKAYIEALLNLINPANTTTMLITISRGSVNINNINTANTDIPSVVRAHLINLRSEILAASASINDKLSKYHLQDAAERIKNGLTPKEK